MPITIGGSGTISGVNVGGLTSTSNGKILQVIQTTKTDTFSMASTTFANVTGMSATITPSSASSTILVLSNISFTGDAGAAAFLMKYTRNGTSIFVGNAASLRTPITWEGITPDDNVSQTGSYIYLDSPATTAAVTYQLQIKSSDGPAIYINRSVADTDSPTRGRGASSIVLLEVAA